MSEPAAEEPAPLVNGSRLLAVADGPPLAPWEPDDADRRPLMPLELLGWDAHDRLVGLRSDADQLVLRSGRPPTRQPLQVERLTQWARAGRITMYGPGGDLEVRLLSPEEYAGLSVGDQRQGRIAGPVRAARSATLAARRDDVGRVLVQRVRRLFPDVQVGTG